MTESSSPLSPLHILTHSKVACVTKEILSTHTQDAMDAENPLRFLDAFPHIVVIAMGGPALCGQVLRMISPNPHRVTFWDNMEPQFLEDFFKDHSPELCGFVVLSKSGQTLETRIECTKVIETLQLLDLSPQKHMLIATEDTENPVRIQSHAHNIFWIPLSHTVDGRFSIFSKTGGILSYLLHVDFEEFKRGARRFLEDPQKMQSYMPIIHDLHQTIATGQFTDHVIFSYDSELFPLMEWWGQLIGESLGKGGGGLTPVLALGPKDQHSQLQLYLGGPRNKFFTFLCTSKGYQEFLHRVKNEHDDFLHMDLESVRGLQMHAVIEALHENQIPARLMFVDKKDTAAMGQFCFQMMFEIWTLGFLSEIDPFGQPDIENVKQKVWDLLQR